MRGDKYSHTDQLIVRYTIKYRQKEYVSCSDDDIIRLSDYAKRLVKLLKMDITENFL